MFVNVGCRSGFNFAQDSHPPAPFLLPAIFFSFSFFNSFFPPPPSPDGPIFYSHLLKYVRIKVIEASSTILAPFDKSLQAAAIDSLTRKTTSDGELTIAQGDTLEVRRPGPGGAPAWPAPWARDLWARDSGHVHAGDGGGRLGVVEGRAERQGGLVPIQLRRALLAPARGRGCRR